MVSCAPPPTHTTTSLPPTALRALPEETNDPGVVDFFRAYELDPAFEPLMDLPTAFPILAAALRGGRGGMAGEPRIRTPVTQLLPGATPSTNAWHRDGGHIRITYILDDLEPGGGGTACLPGSGCSNGRAWAVTVAALTETVAANSPPRRSEFREA